MPSEIAPGKTVKFSRVVQNFISYASGSFEVIKEGYAALFITIVTSVFAGSFLGKSVEILTAVPGLLILLPGVIDMRGDVFSAMASRLGSEFHLGTVKKFDMKNQIVRDNIYASITLTLFLSFIFGILSKILSSIFGLESISVFSLIAISMIGGVLSGIVLLVLTFLISFVSYSRGWDPDNVTSPLITAMGDLVTIPALLIAANFVMSIQQYITFFTLISFILILINMFLILKGTFEFRKMILHSVGILILSGIFSCSSGVFMESNLERLALFPGILLMIPAFLEEGGNIGNILSARLSTKIHLGLVKAEFSLDETNIREIFNALALSLMVFPVIGLFTHLLCELTNISSLGLLKTVFISTFAGFVLTAIVIFSTFIISIVSFRRGIDPDNVLIPIVTSIADLLGIYCLLMISGFVLS